MGDDDMASRASTYRNLPPLFSAALDTFRTSGEKFRVLRSVRPSNPHSPQEPQGVPDHASPRTIFILDSSFNPPSIAHRALVMSALHKDSSDRYPKPHRLLLLFATMNADKAPSATSFDQRLTLMSVFAGDVLDVMRPKASEYPEISVDIGVTTVPYYTDKSAAIATEGAQWYPDHPKHIHLVGFDTLTRFLSPKYYQASNPPLSALEPYFSAGHRLRVTLRPDEQYGNIEEQKAYLHRLQSGELEDEGGKKAWAEQVELVPPNPKAGVSSTRVRKAAKRRDWEEVNDLCTDGVAAYLKSEALYEEDDRGAKMA